MSVWGKVKEAIVGKKKPDMYEQMRKEMDRLLAKQGAPNPFHTSTAITASWVPESKPEPLPVERTTERPVGYRVWRLRDYGDGPVLVSTASDFQWEGPVVSNDAPPPDRWGGGRNTPDRESWGFFAAKALVPIPRYPDVAVSGALDVFGSVVEHEKGYRAQGMRIRKLWLHPAGWTDQMDISIDWRAAATLMSPSQYMDLIGEQSSYRAYSARADAPWYPYDTGPADTVRALEDRYHCDVEFVRVPIGAVTTEQRSPTTNPFRTTFRGLYRDDEPEPEPKPTNLLTPTDEEIERYGNRGADPETGGRTERDGRTPALRTVRGADALRIAAEARA